jgi:hypothetical protein
MAVCRIFTYHVTWHVAAPTKCMYLVLNHLSVTANIVWMCNVSQNESNFLSFRF